jgi:hypothetical protein
VSSRKDARPEDAREDRVRVTGRGSDSLVVGGAGRAAAAGRGAASGAMTARSRPWSSVESRATCVECVGCNAERSHTHGYGCTIGARGIDRTYATWRTRASPGRGGLAVDGRRAAMTDRGDPRETRSEGTCAMRNASTMAVLVVLGVVLTACGGPAGEPPSSQGEPAAKTVSITEVQLRGDQAPNVIQEFVTPAEAAQRSLARHGQLSPGEATPSTAATGGTEWIIEQSGQTACSGNVGVVVFDDNSCGVTGNLICFTGTGDTQLSDYCDGHWVFIGFGRPPVCSGPLWDEAATAYEPVGETGYWWYPGRVGVRTNFGPPDECVKEVAGDFATDYVFLTD